MRSVMLLLALVALAAAAPRHILSTRSGLPTGWTRLNKANAEAQVTFHVAMKSQNVEQMFALLEKVSDPMHVQYGQYLTSAQVRSMTASAPVTVETVTRFLDGADCEVLGDALKCRATVATIERLFETEMFEFSHDNGQRAIRHWGALSVPAEVQSHIDFVSGLGLLIAHRKRAARDMVRDDTDYTIVPETIRNLYNVSSSFAGNPSIGQCVAEFAGEYDELATDLSTFGSLVGQPGLQVSVHAGLPPTTPPPSVETSLDIQYIAALGKGNSNWIWNADGWMFEFAVALQNASSVPSVISMSYAWSEYDQCGDTTDANCAALGVNATGYVQRVNQEFAKVGLLGISMLSASGDSGCHGRTDSDCFFNPYMYPDYPASSPFITAVGGTQLVNGASNNPQTPICQAGQPLAGQCGTSGQEIVSSTGTGSQIVSGGGFALYSPTPSWQAKYVAAYLSNASVIAHAGGTKTPLFNAQGRGYPDISALSHKYYIELSGAVSSVDGTSAASPAIGGLFGLINAHRAARGRPTLGFANPLLYAAFANTNGAAFNDITYGNNMCTEEGCTCTTGFDATPGWDASTGLGTPNFGLLVAAIDAMDEKREAMIRAMQNA